MQRTGALDQIPLQNILQHSCLTWTPLILFPIDGAGLDLGEWEYWGEGLGACSPGVMAAEAGGHRRAAPAERDGVDVWSHLELN